jgi:hypothetical protein
MLCVRQAVLTCLEFTLKTLKTSRRKDLQDQVKDESEEKRSRDTGVLSKSRWPFGLHLRHPSSIVAVKDCGASKHFIVTPHICHFSRVFYVLFLAIRILSETTHKAVPTFHLDASIQSICFEREDPPSLLPSAPPFAKSRGDDATDSRHVERTILFTYCNFLNIPTSISLFSSVGRARH